MPKTIIVIDDDQDDLDIMKMAIEEIDPSLAYAGYIYGEEALRNLNDHNFTPPDYFFIDINMPGITGDKLLKEIRKQPRFDHSVVTLYSTSMPPAVVDHLKENGANYTFEKPVRIKNYVDIISRIFGKE